jgi:DNA processing protein
MKQMHLAQDAVSVRPDIPPSSTDLRYWLALLRAPGVGCVHFQQILQYFDTPEALFTTPESAWPEALSLPTKTRAYLRNPDWRGVEADLQWAEAEACHILSLHDPRYPLLLKEIPDPPPLLFARGAIDALSHPQLAVVGSRNPSAGGRQLAYDFAQQLADAGLTITSGLALGIDAASHQGALDGGGDTLAVAGTGLDRIYPARHRELGLRILEQGAIISEFPPGTPPLASNFPRRNRIISGLSLGTLVVEAAVKSGSLITARLAAEQGREVFAIPGSIHNPLSRGCHTLISQGAKLTESTADILSELGPLAAASLDAPDHHSETRNTALQHLDSAYQRLIENMGFGPISIDTLVTRSGLTPETVSSMLLTLELQGHVSSTGGLYSRTD